MGSILGALLPGVRELRAPLAAGYLWLLGLWLVTRHHIPGALIHQGLVKDLDALSHRFNAAGMVVALGFAAYVIGMLSCEFSTWVLGKVTLIRLGRGPAESQFLRSGLSQRGFSAIEGTCVAQVLRSLAEEGNHATVLNAHPQARALVLALNVGSLSFQDKNKWLARHVDLGNYYQAIADDLKAMPARLMLKRPDAYSAYDRPRMEGEFRAALVIPILFLAVALQKDSGILALVLLAFTPLLIWQARKRLIEANDELAEIMRANDVRESPALASIAPGNVYFTDPALNNEEIAHIRTLARASETVQPLTALKLYKVLAATGSPEGHERLCELTRVHEPDQLIGRLGEGAQYSGRLAFEFVLEALETAAIGEEAFKPVVRGLIWGTRHTEYANTMKLALDALYLSERLSNSDRKRYDQAILEASQSSLEMERFIRDWDLDMTNLANLVDKIRAVFANVRQ